MVDIVKTAFNIALGTYIEKLNGKKRPLGIPTVTDKLVQASEGRYSLDGFSEAKIARIIKSLTDETYQPMPVRTCSLFSHLGIFAGSNFIVFKSF